MNEKIKITTEMIDAAWAVFEENGMDIDKQGFPVMPESMVERCKEIIKEAFCAALKSPSSA